MLVTDLGYASSPSTCLSSSTPGIVQPLPNLSQESRRLTSNSPTDVPEAVVLSKVGGNRLQSGEMADQINNFLEIILDFQNGGISIFIYT